jgi:hypothetical protein
MPQKTAALEREQFEQIADGDLILSDPIAVKQTLIRSYGFELSAESGRNGRKATAVQVASIFLVLGLLAVGAQAPTLGIRSLTMSNEQAKKAVPPAPPKQDRPQPPDRLKVEWVKKGGDESGKERR